MKSMVQRSYYHQRATRRLSRNHFRHRWSLCTHFRSSLCIEWVNVWLCAINRTDSYLHSYTVLNVCMCVCYIGNWLILTNTQEYSCTHETLFHTHNSSNLHTRVLIHTWDTHQHTRVLITTWDTHHHTRVHIITLVYTSPHEILISTCEPSSPS